ncbi:carbon-nitrogen hydrolase [Thioalkalivibrio sp. ALJ16]|uniref:carbon-nitrogen hydrolase n=1 Tax=Thioalkalivibrio sp. ALJ16 TaxID=1158762 RepID=UPI0003690E61|nr:carbon-nitrogen hydrolase [Thioalkalivibrio sp. ALJ16]
MQSSHLPIALIQHRDAGDVASNLDATASAVATAAAAGARLVVLAELHTGPYFCQTEDLATFDRAEPIPGPSSERLGEIARAHGVVLVGSLFERRAPGLYHNTAVVYEADGRLAGYYRKMHIPDDPGYYEKYYFTPGDTGFVPIDTSVGRLGVLVCWDQWYPEAARIMALSGAELLIYPTAIGWDPQDTPDEQARQREAWITVQRGHAVANNLPVIACNRCGHEPDPSGQSPGAQFWGSSFITGPQGEFLASAGTDDPETLQVTLDRGRTEAVRRQWPFLRDRRIDAYAPILKRYIDPH